MIRFNLNGRWIESSEIDPNCTILKYLRTNMKQVDIKEGCAAGDCGACTLMLGEMTEHGIEYRTLNACIALMAQAHNRYLLTPSGIGRPGDLHPAQQAMVECHGSQCGFCTPGFVMSLTNLYQNACVRAGQTELSNDDIHAALSGNLCRCTGYRPIIDAAHRMLALDKKDVTQVSARSGVQTFDPQAADQPLLEKDGCRLFMPETEQQLQALLKQFPDARLWAGGTDAGLEVTQRFSRFSTIICVNRIASLNACQDLGDQLWLGASVTFSQAEQALAADFPSFAQLLHRIGSRQIRNMGTLGGNIANASPIGDTPPVFLALDATLEIDGINGRRDVPIREFYLGYKKTVMVAGEYLRAIRVPKLGADETLWVHKVSKRYDDDISAVLFALYLKRDGETLTAARLACGGMAATPLLGIKTGAALAGQPFVQATFTHAATFVDQDYQPISDVRATDKYRIQVTRNLLTKAFIELNHTCEKGDAA
ncbi:xanthine dehydrogenase small subunit [Thalassolituus sp. LLYu03]|uniref:xanthine dehydrogenase small subunit n=1 Tax=Thalassolituus sp. LLYu03 TaxID=3421656 RepID=UPI003D28DB36